MSKLIATLAALALAAIAGSTLADDSIKAGGKTTETHGRALDEVKAGGKTRDSHGRALEQEKAGKTDAGTRQAMESDGK